jgi:hypothetical protein
VWLTTRNKLKRLNGCIGRTFLGVIRCLGIDGMSGIALGVQIFDAIVSRIDQTFDLIVLLDFPFADSAPKSDSFE